MKKNQIKWLVLALFLVISIGRMFYLNSRYPAFTQQEYPAKQEIMVSGDHYEVSDGTILERTSSEQLEAELLEGFVAVKVHVKTSETDLSKLPSYMLFLDGHLYPYYYPLAEILSDSEYELYYAMPEEIAREAEEIYIALPEMDEQKRERAVVKIALHN